MADAKLIRRWPRHLRLAAPCLAALAVMLSARGDSYMQQREDVGSAAFLNSSSALESFCYGHYGRGGEQTLPRCTPRFGACLNFQRAARDRLNAQWEGLALSLRRRCVREAQDAFSDDQNDPAVRARVSHGGYWRGFAHDAVERCVARRLRRPAPAPAAWSDQPEPRVCRPIADDPLPPEAALTAEAVCADLLAEGPHFQVGQCIEEQSAALARLRPRWRSLSPAMIALCSNEIRAHWEFVPSSSRPRDGWSYTAFETCLARIDP